MPGMVKLWITVKGFSLASASMQCRKVSKKTLNKNLNLLENRSLQLHN